MTPQTSFMYAAPVKPGHEADMRSLLSRMNRVPGVVDPLNPLIPFARFANLHFARVLVVTDLAAADRAVYKLPVTGLPDYLVFMGEIDGDEDHFREELIAQAQDGLRQIFSHCLGIDEQADLATRMAASRVSSAADYVNWVGRTVQQVREEEQLRRKLEEFLTGNVTQLHGMHPQALRATVKSFARDQLQTGQLTLTPSSPTPWRWRLKNLFDLIAVPFLLLLLSPLFLLCMPFLLLQLRRWERLDPQVAPPLDPAHAAELEALEIRLSFPPPPEACGSGAAAS